MRRFFIYFFTLLMCSNFSTAQAHSCSSHYYLTHTDYYEEEQTFADCDKHSMLKQTTVYFYSNGTRRTQSLCTIFNKDGSVLISGCSNVQHLIHNKKHYFIFYKNKKYQIIDENSNILTLKNYKKMTRITDDKILVKLNKKFGIINLNEEVIVPIKYKKFEQIEKDLFTTKLNGYWGIINSSGKILVKNEHEKIKPLLNIYLLKKYDKYGLANKKGEIIFETKYDNIKILDEYIVIKKDKKCALLDSYGNLLTDIEYKDFRLNRNSVEAKVPKLGWIKILEQE